MTTRSQIAASWVLAVVFAFVALLHAYWALGGTWALEESLGEGNPIPPAWLIWVVGALAFIAGIGVLARTGIWGRWIPRIVPVTGTWLLFACLVGAAVLNASTQRFWEMLVIAPICAVLAVLSFVVARSKRSF